MRKKVHEPNEPIMSAEECVEDALLLGKRRKEKVKEIDAVLKQFKKESIVVQA